jgi:GNAT superfamily N-acetyltransferase
MVAMVKDLVPVEVDPNSADADFWRRYHAFRRARQAYERPDDPILPDAVAEKRLRLVRAFDIDVCFEIVRDGEMVSWLTAHTMKPGAPGYETNRDFLEADGYVLPQHRRKGIGRRWLPVALEVLDRHGCRLLNLWSEDEAGHAFLRKLAGEPKFNGAENRLRFSDVDWSMVRRWVEDGEARSPDTKLEIYDGPIPDEMLDEFASQFGTIMNTIPWEDLEHGDIVFTAPKLRDRYARMGTLDMTQHTVLTREPDGVISGITDVSYTPHLPTIVEQMYTGVRPDSRGRGLGKWIKAAMLEKLRAQYPHAEWMITGNAESNGPMLSINHRLGFKEYRSGAEYQISRERLAEVVGKSG